MLDPDEAWLGPVVTNDFGVRFVPFDDAGDCVMLDSGGRCTAEAFKPRECRAFDCSSHGQFLRTHPAVVALLTREGIPMERP